MVSNKYLLNWTENRHNYLNPTLQEMYGYGSVVNLPSVNVNASFTPTKSMEYVFLSTHLFCLIQKEHLTGVS